MSDWQPIETAPKDGQSVLLVRYTGVIPRTKLYPFQIVVGFWEITEWMAQNSEYYKQRDYEALHPTHWMPLPEPPQQ